MADSSKFTITDNWAGGFYELALELGDRSDERLERALRSAWAVAGVEGCFADRSAEPDAQHPVACTLASLNEHGHLHGIVQLPNGAKTVCGVVAIREDDGPDWLDFYLPLGALGHADPRVNTYLPGDPSDTAAGSFAWRRPIDDWLAEVGAGVYTAVGYQLGLIGWEVSGDTYAADLTGDPAPCQGMGYLVPRHGKVRYFPAAP
ncbi:hypothetical protein [Longispora albida]|uniref:hypothetical protein n=1 Tax=Longispora albida TaxID=203523 RepID=UPI00037C16F1|nr:hypothetical protein [Longispora albida]